MVHVFHMKVQEWQQDFECISFATNSTICLVISWTLLLSLAIFFNRTNRPEWLDSTPVNWVKTFWVPLLQKLSKDSSVSRKTYFLLAYSTVHILSSTLFEFLSISNPKWAQKGNFSSFWRLYPRLVFSFFSFHLCPGHMLNWAWANFDNQLLWKNKLIIENFVKLIWLAINCPSSTYLYM